MRIFGAKDKQETTRTYTKRDSDYWENRSTLERLILEAVQEGGEIHQRDLRQLADDAGYSRNSFYTTMSNLRSEGAIDQYGSTVSPGEADDDPGCWDLV